MKCYSVIVIGAGSRGTAYTKKMLAMPEKFRVVAVADPAKGPREAMQRRHNLPSEMCFSSWEEVLSRPKFADLVLICTKDDMHYAPCMQAIDKGYDILLEKPVAQTARECVDIALAAKKKGVKILVCHVLRYTKFFGKIKEIVRSGQIGDVMSVIHVEGVGNVHQSHSYVRGNWHSEAESAPMLLAKSCHDIDIVQWILDKRCKRVQSFGNLSHFNEKYAPEGAPVRCIDGGCHVEDSCPYNCRKLYYDDKNNAWFRGACTRTFSQTDKPTDEEVMRALSTTDYGLCVYHANNDVVDHQVVNMEFEDGATVSFTMNAFNRGGRRIHLYGTKGELEGRMSGETITVYTFEDKQTREIPVRSPDETIVSGHGGGDSGIVYELYDYLGDNYTGYTAADIDISVKNHLIGFAAEKSRRMGTVENIDDFFEQYGVSNT
jgi:predicted dehydrogenase